MFQYGGCKVKLYVQKKEEKHNYDLTNLSSIIINTEYELRKGRSTMFYQCFFSDKVAMSFFFSFSSQRASQVAVEDSFHCFTK